jgi:stage II sporulation protein D
MRKTGVRAAVLLLAFFCMLFFGCARGRGKESPSPSPAQTPDAGEDTGQMRYRAEGSPENGAEKPPLPEALGAEEGQEPSLKVYVVEEGASKEMKFEEYVAGVVGGEIMNDWPEEVIKAQAIIARTFVLQFIDEKGGSRYENAHISTDIEEAQAWDQESVNEAIQKAVEDTRGQVMVYDGEFIRAWFHSNAGGVTATADEGLNFKDGNPPYIQSVESPDEQAPIPEDEWNWTEIFGIDEVRKAASGLGKDVADFKEVTVGEKGPSGRALTIRFDDVEVSAPELRIALGSERMKSTLLEGISLEDNQVVMKGRGYGHGVGMSQWGGYVMAQEGKSAEDIINAYFKDVQIVKMWE